MEEDIKILEDFIEYSQEMINDMEYERPVDVTIHQTQVTALENLIKGYRELHKDNKYLKEHIAMLICLEQENIDLNNELNKLKSKIKEIRDKAEVMDYYVLGDVIDDLNKLLEV